MSIDPLACIFASTTKRVGIHVYCTLHDCWVECQTSHFGEPPMCSYEEPDNSDEAVAARLAWTEEHKEKRDET